MGTKVKEVRDIRTAPTRDPNCRPCHGVPRGHVAADRLWAWSLEHPGEPPFRSIPSTPVEPRHPKETP